MFDRTQAKVQAKQIIAGRLSACVGADAISIILSFVPFGFSAAKVGLCTWYLEDAGGKKPRMSSVLEGFSVFSRALMRYIWYCLFMFLWMLPSLLFIIVGTVIAGSSVQNIFRGGGSGLGIALIFYILAILWIIFIVLYKGSQYDFVFFYMAAHPDRTAKESFDSASEIAKNYVGGIIVTKLSFIGWYILNLFTLNLLNMFYIAPYVNLTYTGLFKQMSGDSAVGASPESRRQADGATEYMSGNYNGGNTQRMNFHSAHKIVGVSGMYSGADFDIMPNQQICIGRDPAYCQIVISSGGESVSRRHCMIQFDENAGCYYVTDFSSNGTYLENGSRLRSCTNREKSSIMQV